MLSIFLDINEIPQFLSCRIICLSFSMWALLMFQFYSASIVVSLITEPPRFINTLSDVADSNLEFGIENIGYMHELFRVSMVYEIFLLYH